MDEIISNHDKIFEQARRERDIMEGRKPEDLPPTKVVTQDDLASIKQMLTIIMNKVRAIDLIVRQNAGRGGAFKEYQGEREDPHTRRVMAFLEGEKEDAPKG